MYIRNEGQGGADRGNEGQSQVCSLLLQLGNGVLSLRPQLIGEHQQAQQLKPLNNSLQLLPGHAAEGLHILCPHYACCQGQQPKALPRVLIYHLGNHM